LTGRREDEKDEKDEKDEIKKFSSHLLPFSPSRLLAFP
jgi:hypothetical protein